MSTSLPPQVISPKQAASIYSNANAFPKQRHVFLVRFNKSGAVSQPTTQMTYSVKSVDRPGIQPVVEEVNQYNKKRQIYTGYKKSAVKCVFYDDAQSSALKMWNDYTKYYFGDFAAGNDSNRSFKDDITSKWADDAKSDFGFTARNGGNSDYNSQWYFHSIDILHFHNKMHDIYTLVNPRLASFDPDELDFSQAEVATISASFVYEAMIFTPNVETKGKPEAEFEGLYNGHTDGTPADSIRESGPGATSSRPSQQPNQTSIEGLLNAPLSQAGGKYGARYTNKPSTGGLGGFGNFIFGSTSGALGNLPNSVRNLGAGILNPLLGGSLGAAAGFDGPPDGFGGVSASMGAATNANPLGGVVDTLTRGVLGAADGAVTAAGGLVLPDAAYGAINAQQPATAQYGFNPNTTPSGQTYGYQGADGVPNPDSGTSAGGLDTPVQASPTQAPNQPSGQSARTAPASTPPAPMETVAYSAQVLRTQQARRELDQQAAAARAAGKSEDSIRAVYQREGLLADYKAPAGAVQSTAPEAALPYTVVPSFDPAISKSDPLGAGPIPQDIPQLPEPASPPPDEPGLLSTD